MRFILRGRRSIWWGWRLTLYPPRILNDVSYVRRINHEVHFAWQAQYLARFEVDFASSAHSKWRFICDADQSWDAFCVPGAVFGEVGVWLFVAGAAFGDILGDSRSNRPHDIKTGQITTTAHHHHGTAEGSFTAKKWFAHRAGRSPCAHSIGKFFPCYTPLFSSETSAPGSPGNYL